MASAATDSAAAPAQPGGTTDPPPSSAADPARLWRAGDGRTVRDIVEHGLGDGSGGGGDSSGPRSVSFGVLPAGTHGSEASGGPESLSQLSLTPHDDDYYEDFTLPGTHEGVMSRQKSFRRRVQAAPVSEPDADRIEHLVRAGELERHGSIRRKLVAPASSAQSSTVGSPGVRFGRDLHEIEQLMEEDGEEVAIDDLPSLGPILGSSTPKTPGDVSEPPSLPPFSEEPLSMELSGTMLKVRECLDQEKLKDIYTISGRLQDILTQEDIVEILNNAETFRELLGEAILAELRSSMSESQQSTPRQSVAEIVSNGSPAGSDSPPSARNTITVQAEVNAEAGEESSSPSISPSPSFVENTSAGVAINDPKDSVSPAPTEPPESRPPVPTPRKLPPPSDLTSARDIPVPSDITGPSSLPADPSPRDDAPSPPPGPLWRSGSLRRLGQAPLEALFAESAGGPVAGQRRILAPRISLDDSATVERSEISEETCAKPVDADSGVSESGTADWQASGENLEASRENLEASRENLEARRENLGYAEEMEPQTEIPLTPTFDARPDTPSGKDIDKCRFRESQTPRCCEVHVLH